MNPITALSVVGLVAAAISLIAIKIHCNEMKEDLKKLQEVNRFLSKTTNDLKEVIENQEKEIHSYKMHKKGKTLRELRKAAKLTAREVGAKMKWHHTKVTKTENAKMPMKVTDYNKVRDFYDKVITENYGNNKKNN
jgi:hypothetical protein